MDHNFEGFEKYGIKVDVGIEYTGNPDRYLVTIERFCKSYEGNRARITEDLEAGNTDDFTIAVHALKSNARMIGASELSSRFEALEMAGKAGDMSVIMNDTPGVLDAYEHLVNGLKPFTTEKETVTADRIDADTAKKVSGELLAALDEFEDDLALALAQKLSGYSFGAAEREMLNKATEQIGEFMYDEAAEIIRQISETIIM